MESQQKYLQKWVIFKTLAKNDGLTRTCRQGYRVPSRNICEMVAWNPSTLETTTIPECPRMLVNSHVNGLPTYTMGYIGVNPLTPLKIDMSNPKLKVWKVIFPFHVQVIFRVPAVNFRRTSVPGISLSSWSKKNTTRPYPSTAPADKKTVPSQFAPTKDGWKVGRPTEGAENRTNPQ